MKKYILVEGKLFMDKVYGDEAEENFKKDQEDWGHKDTVKNVYAIVDKDDYEFYKSEGIMDTNCKYVTTNKEHAIEESNEYNE